MNALPPIPGALCMLQKAAADIIEAVSSANGIPIETLLSRKRTMEVVYPKSLSKFLVRHVFRASLQAVADIFKCDHGTVMHAERIIRNRCDVDPKFRACVQAYIDHFSQKYSSQIRQTEKIPKSL